MPPQAAIQAVTTQGWVVFDPDPRVLAWSEKAHQVGCAVAQDPEMQKQWLQCDGTWFVGVDALPTQPDGSLDGVPLDGPFAPLLDPMPALHPAQLSITYRGYPRPRDGESPAAFGYRQRRDAAHVDGLLAKGPARRRFLKEPHAFILGLPLTTCDAGASPLVVWDKSHHLIRNAFESVLGHHPEPERSGIDLTEVYTQTRRRIFETCTRTVLPTRPGQAVLLHPGVLHGVAPWSDTAQAPAEGRMIAYFRPLQDKGIGGWLEHWHR